MFRNIVYGVCCAMALLGGIAIVEDVKGMKEDVHSMESVCITDRKQFFAITPEQVRSIKEVSFENQDIDTDVMSYWSKLFVDYYPSKVSFDRCHFLGMGICIFNSFVVSELAVTNCALQASDLSSVLAIDPYQQIKRLDLSHNSLGANKQTLIDILNDHVAGVFCIQTLDLRYNDLDSSFLEGIASSLSSSVGSLLF